VGRYIIQRVLESLPVLVGISIITFLVIRLAPGDPASLLYDMSQLSPDQQDAIRRAMGLEDPLWVQYGRLMSSLLTGQLLSMRLHVPTLQLVASAAPVTLMLGGLTLLVGIVLGLAFGVWSALRANTVADDVLTAGTLLGLSLPQFWVGLMLVYFLAETLRWLPAAGIAPPGQAPGGPLEMLPYLIMPTVALSSGIVAAMTRYVRSGMLEALGQDFVRTARAKGLNERAVVLGHALRHSLITVVSLLGVLIPVLLGGTVVVENVFALPGIGQLAVTAAMGRDYPVVMTVNLISAVLVIASNLAADVAYGVVDPRIRIAGS
jgi:peptide/nickel transport system permease protein